MALDEAQMAQYEAAVRAAEIETAQQRTQNYQQEMALGQQDKSMIQEQLDLGDELDRIDYLLRGYTIERNEETGESKWAAPKNNDMIILSEYGVHLIRNTIAWYLNKNTLLSNYEDTVILSKMEDFASDLNDTVFMEYEKVFQYPSFDDCKKILDERIQKKKEIRVYAMQILGKKLTETEVKDVEEKIVKEVEPIVEKELEKIKQQIIKNKLKRFMILIREIQDAVHSTYLRAWKGQERTTLRQHIHISETKGGVPMPQQGSGGAMGWFRRK